MQIKNRSSRSKHRNKSIWTEIFTEQHILWLPSMRGHTNQILYKIQSEEVECRCEGEALTRVPQTLTMAMQRLTIASAGLPRLRATGLKVYAQTLLDVWVVAVILCAYSEHAKDIHRYITMFIFKRLRSAFTDCLQLELIQDGAFGNLNLLRTMYGLMIIDKGL